MKKHLNFFEASQIGTGGHGSAEAVNSMQMNRHCDSFFLKRGLSPFASAEGARWAERNKARAKTRRRAQQKQ